MYGPHETPPAAPPQLHPALFHLIISFFKVKMIEMQRGKYARTHTRSNSISSYGERKTRNQLRMLYLQ
jgi:hypothetical protein